MALPRDSCSVSSSWATASSRSREPGEDGFLRFDRSGKKVFFDLASRLLPDVRRSSGSLVPEDPEADILVLLGPARYPDRAQWQTLHDWVSEGRALVFAAKWQDPAVDLEPLRDRDRPRAGRRRRGPTSEDPAKQTEEPGIETDLVRYRRGRRRLAFLTGQVRYTDPKGTIVVSAEGYPQVVWQPVGDGIIVVAASDFIFSNLSLIEARERRAGVPDPGAGTPAGPVYFDEELNQAGAPKVVGVLLEGPFRLPTIQLLIVTLLFGWMVSRRFGPLVRKGRPERRSLVEHAEALGSPPLQSANGLEPSRSRTWSISAGSSGLAYRTGPKGRELQDVRARGKDAKETISRAIRASKSRSLDRARVATVIRSLAALRLESK